MSPVMKILLYIIFLSLLFLNNNIKILFTISIISLLYIFFSKKEKIRSGILPITLFLIAVFAGNLFFEKGRIILNIFGVDITEEGITIASIRTLRIFMMIAGAKFLVVNSKIEDLIKALGTFFKPLQFIKIPVNDFIDIMVLSVKTFPVLKKMIRDKYKEDIKDNKVTGLKGKAMIVTSMLIPFFISTIHSPEKIFKEIERQEEEDREQKSEVR